MNGFKILDKIAPSVPVVENTVTDRSTLITGKAESKFNTFILVFLTTIVLVIIVFFFCLAGMGNLGSCYCIECCFFSIYSKSYFYIGI